jgi:sensor histidine kinase YesM
VNWQTATVGVGISNMKSRLHRLYGNEFELRFENERRGGVEVSVIMPFVASTGDV